MNRAGEHSNSENIEKFSNVQRQNFSEIAKMSLTLFSTKKKDVEYYTEHFKELQPMLM